MAVIQSLRSMGEEVHFYNIDYFRYGHDEVKAYFAKNQFDVVGISAVVSTAYAYTKYLADLIRTVSPETVIVVGGNLAASAEILLRKCSVDFCVVGDGELIIQDLIKALNEKPRNYERLRATKGICFLDENGQFYFSGYGSRPTAEAIESPDYDILEADGSLPYFVSERIDDARFHGHHHPPRPGERAATVVMTKGCVARCTFCHRWEKGFRARPVDQVIEHVQYLKDRYNVRFIDVADENFGSDRELAWELATRLGELGMVWRVAGVRARTVTKEVLQHWNDNGCVSVIYGIESGSPKMLDVMEKNVTVSQNINAVRLAYETGLFTVIQLVLAMPGETDETIRETTEFAKEVSPYLILDNALPSTLMSLNYAQALPGTPLYEYARQHGFIGKTVDEEEKYLLRISDTDAYATDHFINYTGLPMLKVIMWREWMLAQVDAHYLKSKSGGQLSLLQVIGHCGGLLFHTVDRRVGGRIKRLLKRGGGSAHHAAGQAEDGEEKEYDYFSDSGYFNIRPGSKFAPLLLNSVTEKLFVPMLALGMALGWVGSPVQSARLLFGWFRWSLMSRFRPAPPLPDKSLRKVVKIEPVTIHQGADMMIPLRMGR